MNTRELWDALERDQIEVHLQSEVWLEDGRHFGFEALPRLAAPRPPDSITAKTSCRTPSGRRISLPLARRLVERACQELEGRDGMRPDALVSVAPTGLGEPGIYETVTSAPSTATGTAAEPALPGGLVAARPIEQLDGCPRGLVGAAPPSASASRSITAARALRTRSSADAMPLGLLALFPFDYVRRRPLAGPRGLALGPGTAPDRDDRPHRDRGSRRSPSPTGSRPTPRRSPPSGSAAGSRRAPASAPRCRRGSRPQRPATPRRGRPRLRARSDSGPDGLRAGR